MGFLTLFRKTPAQPPLNVGTVESTAIAVPGGSRENVLAKHGVRSLLDHGMTVAGNLVSERGAAIDGIVNGDVTVNDGNAALLLRASAVVRGVVRAPIVMVSGTVEGGIEARFVRLFPGSKVIGKIRATRLVVDDGATIVNEDVGTGIEQASAVIAHEAHPSVVAPLPPATPDLRDAWRGSPTLQAVNTVRPSLAPVGQSSATFLRQSAQ